VCYCLFRVHGKTDSFYTCRPFSWELWGLVFGFLFFSGFVNMLADNRNEDDFQNSHPVARVFKVNLL